MTIEELFEKAQENGVKLGREQAEAILEKIKADSGVLPDEELETVAGGARYRIRICPNCLTYCNMGNCPECGARCQTW